MAAPTASEADKAKGRKIRAEAAALVRNKREQNALTPTEVSAIENYLRAPVSTGHWRLSVKRRFDGAYMRHLADKNEIDSSELIPDPQNPHVPTARPTEEESKAIRAGKQGTLMRALLAASLGSSISSDETLLGNALQKEDFFDPAQVAEIIPEAVSYFREKILFDNFLPIPMMKSPFRLRSGFSLIFETWLSNEVLIFSIAKEPLEDLAQLFLLAEVAESCLVERIFSPEEELFAPYFHLLTIVFDRIISDKRASDGFSNAFEYFQKDDFTHCISSLGLVAEEYLTQVFEYYLRTPCSKGSTLGQLYDQLNSKVLEIVAPAKVDLIDTSELLKAAKALKPKRKDAEYHERVELVLRDVILALKSSNEYFETRSRELSKTQKRQSVFPASIQDNILELIRNRNAASHKNRYPLGNFEALRTLYCLTAFVMWWRGKKATTDWSREIEPVLREAIGSAQPR